MPNSENKNKGLKNTFKSLAWWIGFAAKFIPGPLKVWALLASTLLGGVVAVMNNCDAQTQKQKAPPISATPCKKSTGQ